MSWAHVWAKRGHQTKTCIVDAGRRLDCASLSPWLQQTFPCATEDGRGLIVELGGIQTQDDQRLERQGLIRLPDGRRLAMTFVAELDAYRGRRRWYGLCGACGKRATIFYLEQDSVPLCRCCARVRYVGEGVSPDMRGFAACFRQEWGLDEDPVLTRLEWLERKAAAQRIRRILTRKK